MRASEPPAGASRWTMLLLVCAALAVLSFRLACELAFAGHSHGAIAAAVMQVGNAAAGYATPGDPASGSCCSRIEDGTLVKPADALAWRMQGAPLGAALFASTALLLFARRRIPEKCLYTALPGRSFYARCTRILR